MVAATRARRAKYNVGPAADHGGNILLREHGYSSDHAFIKRIAMNLSG